MISSDGVSELRSLSISVLSYSASRSELRRGSGEELGSSAVVNLTGQRRGAASGERSEDPNGAGGG